MVLQVWVGLTTPPRKINYCYYGRGWGCSAHKEDTAGLGFLCVLRRVARLFYNVHGSCLRVYMRV